MRNLAVFGLAVSSLILGALADPIFLLSSRKINDISQKLFFDTDSFNTLLSQKVLQKDSLPSNVFIFNVNLNKKYAADTSLILKELASQPTLQTQFGSSSNTFSSIYVKDALSAEFSDKILSNIRDAGDFEVVRTNLNEFDFNRVKDFGKTQNKNLVTVVNLAVSQLGQLNKHFREAYNGFAKTSTDNHLIILKFTESSDVTLPHAITQLEINERLLQDEDVPASEDAAAAADAAGATADETTTVYITSVGFNGIIVSIVLLIAVYIGFQVMQDVKSSSRFYKDQLQIGKEL